MCGFCTRGDVSSSRTRAHEQQQRCLAQLSSITPCLLGWSEVPRRRHRVPALLWDLWDGTDRIAGSQQGEEMCQSPVAGPGRTPGEQPAQKKGQGTL